MSDINTYKALNTIASVAQAKALVDKRQLSHVKIGLFDHDGIMLSKYLSKHKFFSALDDGFGFCDVIFGWDSKDKIIDNLDYTGWHTGYPDASARIIYDSARNIVGENNQLLFLAEMTGKAEAICPRVILKRIIKKYEESGLLPLASFEYEFFLFNETPETIRAKGFQQLNTFTPDNFGYSGIRNSVHARLYHDILNMAETMNFPIEGLHTETGPGVLEAALCYDKALEAADKAALFKTFMKVLAERSNIMATFMAKWSADYSGQSGHIHVSLREKETGRSSFYNASKQYCMSETQHHFIAGLQHILPELLVMLAPNINSYRRFIPGSWAPTSMTWGIENRTTALRVISGSDKSQRVECRIGGADSNPYLGLAAVLGAGLYGIKHRLEPLPAVSGNAYEQKHNDKLILPSSLGQAVAYFRDSEIAHELFGEIFVNHFATSRAWEETEFRRHVSTWELDRYFEVI